MRWIIISLLIVNSSYFVSGLLEYTHYKKLSENEVRANNKSPSEQNMPGGRINLLQEEEVNMHEYRASEILSEAIGVPPKTINHCLLYGPIPKMEDLQFKRLKKELNDQGIESQIKGTEVSGEPDYWVYLQPELSREVAILKLKELQEKKIDSFIIPEGVLTNGISLGVFDKRENAERRKREVSDIGYAAEISESASKYTENWLLIKTQNAENSTAALLNKWKTDGFDIKVRKEECSEVASWQDIN